MEERLANIEQVRLVGMVAGQVDVQN